MPRKHTQQAASTNPAASALGIGAEPHKWTMSALMGRLGERYTELIKHAHEEEARGRQNRGRLFWAQAAEVAALIAEYQREHGDAEGYERWLRRQVRAENTAFRVRNSIVESLGAGLQST